MKSKIILSSVFVASMLLCGTTEGMDQKMLPPEQITNAIIAKLQAPLYVRQMSSLGLNYSMLMRYLNRANSAVSFSQEDFFQAKNLIDEQAEARKMEAYANEVQDLRTQFTESNRNLNQAQTEAHDLQTRLNTAGEQFTRSQTEVQDLRTQFTESNRNLNQAQTEARDLQTRLNTAEEQLTLSQTAVQDLRTQLTESNRNLNQAQTEAHDLQTRLNTAEEQLTLSRTEVLAIQERLAASERESEKRRLHLEMLCDYSKIPDNLYEGKSGIRSDKFGKALKEVLEMVSIGQQRGGKNAVQFLRLGVARCSGLLQAIDVDSFSQGQAKFAEVYMETAHKEKEADFKRLLLEVGNGEYPLSYYLQNLATVILYINDDPDTRFLLFFDNIRLLISEMLKYHPFEM